MCICGYAKAQYLYAYAYACVVHASYAEMVLPGTMMPWWCSLRKGVVLCSSGTWSCAAPANLGKAAWVMIYLGTYLKPAFRLHVEAVESQEHSDKAGGNRNLKLPIN